MLSPFRLNRGYSKLKFIYVLRHFEKFILGPEVTIVKRMVLR